MFAADFLLAFDDKGQVARKFGVGFQVGFNGVQVGQVLAFVVAGPAREKRAPFQPRLKGRAFPKLERLRRLHVVMAIDQVMAACPSRLVLATHDGMAGRRAAPAPPGRFRGNV